MQRVTAIGKQQNPEQYKFLFLVIKINMQTLAENKTFRLNWMS